MTGRTDKIAKKANHRTEFQVKRVGIVAIFSDLPAIMAIAEGGATPMSVPKKNGISGTPIIGEVTLINQLGNMGVIRRNIM